MLTGSGVQSMLEREHKALEEFATAFPQFLRNNDVRLLRLTLGIVFLWFGALKILGETSVLGIIQSAYPFLARTPFLQTLGLGETVIGIGLLLGWQVRTFAVLTVFHLGGTLLVLFLAPSAAFDPNFPMLTLQGEFVMKNLVLISAAFLLAARNESGTSFHSSDSRSND